MASNIHSEDTSPTLLADDRSVHEAEKGTTAALVRSGVADGLQKAGLRVGGFDAADYPPCAAAAA